MTDIAPGWYRDPVDPTVQRYWDGEGWLGEPLPADATPPAAPTPPPAPQPAQAPASRATALPPAPTGAGTPPGSAPGSATGSAAPRGPLTPGAGVHPSVPPAWITSYPAMQIRPHGLALASAGRRFAARLIDILAVTVLCVVANAWFGYQFWQTIQPTWIEFWRRVDANDLTTEPLPAPTGDPNTLVLMMLFVILAVWFAYEVPATANSGQTLGKRVTGIKVMRIESRERLGFGRSWRRWSRLGVPTLLWPCCFVGVAMQAIDCLAVVTDRPLKQALHDKGAGTIVVKVLHGPDGSRAGDVARTDESQDVPVGGRDADPNKP